jgi:hypothetical protein
MASVGGPARRSTSSLGFSMAMRNLTALWLVPAWLGFQAILWKLTNGSGRRYHVVDADGVNIFRTNSFAAWFITISGFAFFSLVAYVIFTTKHVEPVDWVGGLFLLFIGFIGIYYLTLCIRVDSQSLRVGSFLGARTTYFRDIRSVDSNEVGRWYTLNVINMNGKRILYVSSTVLLNYHELVNLLEDGTNDRKVREARAPGMLAKFDDDAKSKIYLTVALLLLFGAFIMFVIMVRSMGIRWRWGW